MKTMRFLRGAALGVVGGLFLLTAASAQVATDASAFGAAGVDPVVIGGTWTLSCVSPSSFDFGPRHVVFDAGTLVETNGCVVKAARITVSAGATLHGAVTLRTNAASSTYDGGILVAGLIDASGDVGDDGGWITLDACDDVAPLGYVDVVGNGALVSHPGTGYDRRGGDVSLRGVSHVTLDGASPTVDVGRLATGAAGNVDIMCLTGPIDVRKGLRAVGDAGGDVTIDGHADIFIRGPIDTSSAFNVDAAAAGAGSIVIVTDGGSLTTTADLRADTEPATSPFPVDVTLTCHGDLTVGGGIAAGGDLGPRTFTAFCGGDYVQTGSFSGAGYWVFLANGGRGANVDIYAVGRATITGLVDVRGGDGMELPGLGGNVSVVAHDRLAVGSVVTTGLPGGDVFLTGDEDVLTGTIDTSSSSFIADSGVVRITARRDALLGPIVAHTYSAEGTLPQPGPVFVTADRDVFLSGIDAGTSATAFPATAVSVVAGRVLDSGGPLVYPTFVAPGVDALTLAACRVRIHAPIRPWTAGTNPGCGVGITAGDQLLIGALIDATPAGAVRLTTRLAPPWAPTFDAGGAILPPPLATVEPSLPPCLALGRAWWSAPTVLVSGTPLIVTLHGGSNLPILVGAALAFAHLDLGALGRTQVDPFTALRLADPGFLGAALPGSTTGALGAWSFATPTPPGLAGLTVVFDGYVFDPQAWNGVFDQPPAAVVTFQ